MANPELGSKQICPNCQTKFYDLGRRPAHCPKCGTDFDPEEAVRSRRVRARSAAPEDDAEDVAVKPKPDADEDEGFEEADATPEIDQPDDTVLAADDDEDADAPVTEVEGPGMSTFEEEDPVAEDEVDDVPFLEEEGDDDLGDDDLVTPADEEP